MGELPIPPKGNIVNPEWASILEKAICCLWDGVTSRLGKNEYICNAIVSVIGPVYGDDLQKEINKRLSSSTYEAWLSSELGPDNYSSKSIQDGRRRWMLQLIREFKGEKA